MGTKLALRKVKARYGAMTLFGNDTGALTRSLRLYGEWAQQELELITGLFEPGATVLDVGAYIGTHTLAFANRVGPSGTVLAFEAQPRSFELLERNVAANQLPQVQLHHAAVSDVVGAIEFTPVDASQKESFGSASLAAILRAHGNAISTGNASVSVTTIDALKLDRCDFVKVDVEDSEDLVLKGATRTIDRCRPVIYAECNSVDAGVRIGEILRSHGYELRLHLVSAFNPENFVGERKNIFGTAREAAILGGPPGRRLPDARTGPTEMLLPFETTDDLVLGLLNKPQYVGEVLDKTAAARLTQPISIGRPDDEKRAAVNDAPAGGATQAEATQAAPEQAQALASERQQEIKHLETRLDTTQAALESAQQLAAGRQTEIERQLDRLGATEAALEAAHQLATAGQAEIERLTERLDATQAALESARKLATARQTQVAGLESHIEESRATLERAQHLAATRHSEIEELTNRIDATQAALESVQKLAMERQAQIDRLEDRVRTTQAALESVQELAVERHREVEGLTRRLDHVQAALESTQELAGARQIALESAEARTAQHERAAAAACAKSDAAMLQATLARRNANNALSKLRENESEVERMLIALQHAEAKANSLLASTSWRLTAPLRRLRRLLPRR